MTQSGRPASAMPVLSQVHDTTIRWAGLSTTHQPVAYCEQPSGLTQLVASPGRVAPNGVPYSADPDKT